MLKVFKALTIIVLLVISGCSNPMDQSGKENNEFKTVDSTFTGTIEEINDKRALVSCEEGNVFVDLSVNSNETFRIGDEIKVRHDGTIKESDPAQINTLSVEIIE